MLLLKVSNVSFSIPWKAMNVLLNNVYVTEHNLFGRLYSKYNNTF